MTRLLVGTVKGGFIFRSDDDRRSWRLEREIFPGWKVTAASRTRSGQFLVGTASYVYGATVQIGTDMEHWQQAEQSPAFSDGGDKKLDQIWRFNTESDVLYAGVSDAGLFKSQDDGQTWYPIEGLNSHQTRKAWVPGFGGLCAHAIIVDRQNSQRIWCGISAVGVFRSDDGGITWLPKNEGVTPAVAGLEGGIGFCVHGLTSDPDDANIMYRQDHMGMYRSLNGGDTWQKIEDGLPSGFGFPICRDRSTGTLFVFPQESPEYRMPPDRTFTVYRSTDHGDHWEPAGLGPPSYAGVLRGAMTVDSETPCGVYAGSTSGTVHISRDGGEQWSVLPHTLPRILCTEVFVM